MSKILTINACRRDRKFEYADDTRFFLTADTHVGHSNIIKYCKRPFFATEEERQASAESKDFKVSKESAQIMSDEIIRRTNEVVRSQDVIIHHGDVAFEDYGRCKEYWQRINCKNFFLIWGNHDLGSYAEFFPCNYDACLIILPSGQKIHASHYPHDTWEGSHKSWWHTFGHVHSGADERRAAFPAWSMSLDVGVDGHNFYPWSEDELIEYFGKRRAIWQEWKKTMRPKEEGGMAPSTIQGI